MGRTRSRIGMHLRTTAVAVLGALALAVGTSAPAGAITYGAPDGTAHPAVGSLVVTLQGHTYQLCTVTLVAPKVALTAAHCLYGDLQGLPLEVTFDPVITDGGTTYGGHGVYDPAYTEYQGAGGRADAHDVGVFLLDTAPAGITPVPIAAAGALSGRDLRSATFTTVGYGSTRDTQRGGNQAIDDTNMERRVATQSFLSVTRNWLNLSMNPATGSGGTCYGDSGGPHMLDGAIVSVTATGDSPCKALDATYRVDTAEAHAFLDPYLAS